MQPNTWDYEHVREDADRAMEDLRNSPALIGLKVKTLSAAGDVLRVTRQLATEEKVDLVVLGTHGRTGFRKVLMGSVAEEVERLLCVSGDHGRAVGAGRSAGSGSVPLDPVCDRFFRWIGTCASLRVSFAHESGATLHLLHVIAGRDGHGVLSPRGHGAQLQAASGAIVPAGLLPIEPDIIVATGVPPEAIVKQAMLTDADLIVMGIHKSGLRGAQASAHIPWSVANAVVAHAPCPVLTVCGMLS